MPQIPHSPVLKLGSSNCMTSMHSLSWDDFILGKYEFEVAGG